MSNIVLEFNCETNEVTQREMTAEEIQEQAERVEPSAATSTQDSLQELFLLKKRLLLLEEKLSQLNSTGISS